MCGERVRTRQFASLRCRLLGAGAAAAMLLACSACAGPRAVEAPTRDAEVEDHADLVEALRVTVGSVDDTGRVVQPFFAVPGIQLRVSGGALSEPVELQSFDYQSAAAARADLEKIGPGVQPRTAIVDWVAPAHLYGSGRVLVLYVGEDPQALSLLRRVLGPPLRQGG